MNRKSIPRSKTDGLFIGEVFHHEDRNETASTPGQDDGTGETLILISNATYNLESLLPSIDRAIGLGLATAPKWFAMIAETSGGEVNAWDLCHRLLTQGFGVAAMASPQYAEPDFEQQWIFGTDTQQALALTRTGDKPDDPDPRYPRGDGYYRFRDKSHSQLEDARSAVGEPPVQERVRIAHLDTGYDPKHSTLARLSRRNNCPACWISTAHSPRTRRRTPWMR